MKPYQWALIGVAVAAGVAVIVVVLQSSGGTSSGPSLSSGGSGGGGLGDLFRTLGQALGMAGGAIADEVKRANDEAARDALETAST